MTVIPLDFLPVEAKSKKEALEGRLAECRAFDKRHGNNSAVSIGIDTTEKIQARLDNVKELVKMYGKPRIIRYFGCQFQQAFPDFRFGGVNTGRKVQSLDDFCEALRSVPFDNAMRYMVWWALHGLWEKNNAWAIPLEEAVLKTLRWQYSGFYCDGSKKARVHQGGCIKAQLVVAKNSCLAKIKDVLARLHKVAIYARCPPKITTESIVKKKNDRSKKIQDSLTRNGKYPKKVAPIQLEWRVATKEGDGFYGFLGFFEGHSKFSSPTPFIGETNGAATHENETNGAATRENEVCHITMVLSRCLF